MWNLSQASNHHPVLDSQTKGFGWGHEGSGLWQQNLVNQ